MCHHTRNTDSLHTGIRAIKPVWHVCVFVCVYVNSSESSKLFFNMCCSVNRSSLYRTNSCLNSLNLPISLCNSCCRNLMDGLLIIYRPVNSTVGLPFRIQAKTCNSHLQWVMKRDSPSSSAVSDYNRCLKSLWKQLLSAL